MARYRRDRDTAALEAAMRALDQQEAQARAVHADGLTSDEAIESLRELPQLWDDAEPLGRQMLASALFDRIDVLGMREATVSLSAHAVRHGLAAVLPPELRIPVYGRGERT